MATILALMTHVPRGEHSLAPTQGPTLLLDHTWNHDQPSAVVTPSPTLGDENDEVGTPHVGTLGTCRKAGTPRILPRKGAFAPYTAQDRRGEATFVYNAITRALIGMLQTVMGGAADTVLLNNAANDMARSACVGFIEGRDFLFLTRHTGRAHRPFDLFGPHGVLDGHAPHGWPSSFWNSAACPYAKQDQDGQGHVGDTGVLDPHALLVGHVYAPTTESAHARVARAARIREDLALLSRYWDGQDGSATSPTAFALAFPHDKGRGTI